MTPTSSTTTAGYVLAAIGVVLLVAAFVAARRRPGADGWAWFALFFLGCSVGLLGLVIVGVLVAGLAYGAFRLATQRAAAPDVAVTPDVSSGGATVDPGTGDSGDNP